MNDVSEPVTTPKPGSREWLQARIAEHKHAQEQALGQANAHNGAWMAYERLLAELDKAEEEAAPAPEHAA